MNYLTAQFKKSLKSVKGFSLIELMVVVSIIAILAIIGAVIYSTVQSRGRDAKRQSDVASIAAALESKKDPSAANYVNVAATDFSAGLPDDPTEPREYCIDVETTKTIPAAPAAWVPVDLTPCATNFAEFTVTAVPNTTLSWRVCTLLENTVNGSTVFCKASSQ